MTGAHDRLTDVLDGYANFLREKKLTHPMHQPYMVRWVKDFLLFAREHVGYTFEQMLSLFLTTVGGRVSTKPWQLQQASDTIRIYRYQYRGAKNDGESGSPAGSLNDEAAMLVRLRELIRACGITPGAPRRLMRIGTAASWPIAARPVHRANHRRLTPRRS